MLKELNYCRCERSTIINYRKPKCRKNLLQQDKTDVDER